MGGPQDRRLHTLVGNWHTRGRITTPGGPADEIDSRDTYEWLPGQFFILHRWDSRIGESHAAGIEVIGADGETDRYRTHFFDNGGGSGSEQLTVAGNTWTWLGENVMGVRWHRCISTVSDDGNTMTARHEQSADGVAWTPWMDVTLRRTS